MAMSDGKGAVNNAVFSALNMIDDGARQDSCRVS
jgi:hypothetical protein